MKRDKLPPLQTERISISTCPALLYHRKAIELAFQEACKCYRGQPTQEALEAVNWIMARTDWTRFPIEKRMELWGEPAPPKEIRKMFAASFEACCAELSLDPDKVRMEGLQDARLYTHKQTRGLPAIWECWLEARQRYLEIVRLTPIKERRYSFWRKASEQIGQSCLF